MQVNGSFVYGSHSFFSFSISIIEAKMNRMKYLCVFVQRCIAGYVNRSVEVFAIMRPAYHETSITFTIKKKTICPNRIEVFFVLIKLRDRANTKKH